MRVQSTFDGFCCGVAVFRPVYSGMTPLKLDQNLFSSNEPNAEDIS